MGVRRVQRLCLCLSSVLLPALGASAQAITERVSLDSEGSQVLADSLSLALSADASVVVFESLAQGLVPGDTNGVADVFVRELDRGVTTRISVGPGRLQADGRSWRPAVSADGRWVAFESEATNLVPGDDNGWADVFVHDRLLGLTTLVSATPTGAVASGASQRPSISWDGRWVTFESAASDLVAGDGNGSLDVFLRNLPLGSTSCLSLTLEGLPAGGDSREAVVSGDGLYVAFSSEAGDLVAGDGNGVADVFLHSLGLGETVLVSHGPGGLEGDGDSTRPVLSADGRRVVFESAATNLVPGDVFGVRDVFLADLETGTLQLVSSDAGGTPGAQASGFASVSGDGRFVAFASLSPGLVPGDTNGLRDVFVKDLATGALTRSSVHSSGAQGDDSSYAPSLAADGSCVAFRSWAGNLVEGDSNGVRDVFVHQRLPAGGLGPYCSAKTNSLGCLPRIETLGLPSASAPRPFEVRATGVVSGQNGLLFYGWGPAAIAFQGGWLCVDPTRTERLPASSSGGPTSPADCRGVLRYDLNLQIQGGLDPALIPGSLAFCQFWYRDPGSPSGSGLSGGLAFLVLP